jgi:hypothetical protein
MNAAIAGHGITLGPEDVLKTEVEREPGTGFSRILRTGAAHAYSGTGRTSADDEN